MTSKNQDHIVQHSTHEDVVLQYQAVLEELKNACEQVGRNAQSVKLMLVSKTVPLDRIQKAIDAGHVLFGENKVQELAVKQNHFKSQNVQFDFIGHLQTNKVKKCIETASRIHSLDRMSLAIELDKQLSKVSKTMDVFIQVNTSGEDSKFGVEPEKALDLIREVSLLPSLKVKGLMTLAKFSAKEEEVRPCFKILKHIFDQAKSENIPGVSMEELSMGMSSDYKIAIEEGATIIRVGTAVFGSRKYSDDYYWPEDNKK